MAIEKHMLQTHSLFEKAGDVLEGVAELKKRLSSIQSDKMQLEDDNALLRRNNAELKAENAELKKKCEAEKSIGATFSKNGAELARWVEELRKEIESLKASHYAEMVDAGMRERRLKRALWLARANRALEKIAWFKLWNASISTMNPEDGARQEYDKWKKALGKLLKKSKEYL